MNLNQRLNKEDLKKQKRKRLFKKLVYLLVFLLILGLAVYLPARSAYIAAKKMNLSAKAISTALKQENLDLVNSNLKDLQKSSEELEGSLGWLFWVKAIPYIGGFYADAQHFSKALNSELSASSVIVESLLPYKEELGFTGTPSPNTDRVSQLTKILDRTLPNLDKVEPQLKKASEEVKSVDVNKYPDTFGGRPIKQYVSLAKDYIIGIHTTVTTYKPAVEVIPSSLGQPNEKNYLLLFQNDKELRPTGGFITAYSLMNFKQGRMSTSLSDDIYKIDDKIINKYGNNYPFYAPAALQKYLPDATGAIQPKWYIRDSNMSPDIPTSMEQFENMYKSVENKLSFDGIVLIDTFVVADLLKITGPVEAAGVIYSANIEPKCNCPQAIYLLQNYTQKIEQGDPDRKAILGPLMQEILLKLLNAPTSKLPELLNLGIKLANSKHIMFYMHDSKTQKALSDLNWTGEIKEYNGDYLHINDANLAAGKTNLYIKKSVNLEIDTKGKDLVKNKLTITYENPKEAKAWLNALHRDYIRIYVPKGSKLLSSKGSDVKVTTIENELDKTVFEAFIQVKPQTPKVIEFEYQLPYGFNGKEYPILIQKQPGVADFPYEIKINGKTKEKFNLDMDKELKIGI